VYGAKRHAGTCLTDMRPPRATLERTKAAGDLPPKLGGSGGFAPPPTTRGIAVARAGSGARAPAGAHAGAMATTGRERLNPEEHERFRTSTTPGGRVGRDDLEGDLPLEDLLLVHQERTPNPAPATPGRACVSRPHAVLNEPRIGGVSSGLVWRANGPNVGRADLRSVDIWLCALVPFGPDAVNP